MTAKFIVWGIWGILLTLGILFLTVLFQRIRSWKTDKYKDVEN